MHSLYNIFIHFYGFGMRLASLFNPKAKRWIDGRSHWLSQLESFIASNHKDVLWVHCASLGEYEQGQPIINALENAFPKCQVLVSFFSPSGYEVVKEKRNGVFYLPLDTKENAIKWIDTLKPKAAFFIKNEFWPNILKFLFKRDIPTYSISSHFRKNQDFFKRSIFSRFYLLKYFKHFFVQDKASKDLLHSIGIETATISGDTRIERVKQLANESFQDNKIESFAKHSNIFIAGSIWPSDHEILQSIINDLPNHWKVIIAPHEPSSHPYPNFGRTITKYSDSETAASDILYIDEVGLLSRLYRYGHLAYIGGGFNKGIHNVLEPAAYSLPIVCGPKIEKFPEALQLKRLGALFAVEGKDLDLKTWLEDQVFNDDNRQQIGAKSCNFITSNANASAQIIDYIKKDLFLE